MSKSGKSTTLATTSFYFLNPVANMAANYVCMTKLLLLPLVPKGGPWNPQENHFPTGIVQ